MSPAPKRMWVAASCRLFGNRWLPQTTCSSCAGCSGGLLPPSPPAEKASARQDKAGKASTGDGRGNAHPATRDSVVETEPSSAAHRFTKCNLDTVKTRQTCAIWTKAPQVG